MMLWRLPSDNVAGKLLQSTSFIRAMSSTTMFVARPNPLNPEECVWVPVENPGASGEDDCNSLVAASSYLDMLTDSRRNRCYALALERATQRLAARLSHSNNTRTPMPSVLDIGTGTGLLAMMAAKALAHNLSSTLTSIPPQQPPVTACEVFPPMAGLAKRIVAANNLSSWVKVVHCRSDELSVAAAAEEEPSSSSQPSSDSPPLQPAGTAARSVHKTEREKCGPTCDPDRVMPSKCDIIVSEIVDSELLGEGILPTMRHAAKHLLKEGGVMIPGSATVWGQLVQCSVLDQMQRLQVAPAGHSVGHTNTGAHAAPGIPPPGSFKQASHTLQAVMRMIADLDAAARISSSSSAQVPANSTTTDQGLQWQRLHGLHVDPLCESGLLQPLSPPVRLMSFDFTKPPLGDQEVSREIPVTTAGTPHALVVWWQMHLDPQDPSSLVVSTAPKWVGQGVERGGDDGPLPAAVSPVRSLSQPQPSAAASPTIAPSATAPSSLSSSSPAAAGTTNEVPGGVLPQQWRDHWAQCWVGVTRSQKGQLQAGATHYDSQGQVLTTGQTVHVWLRHDDVSFSACVQPGVVTEGAPALEQQPAPGPVTQAAASHMPQSGGEPVLTGGVVRGAVLDAVQPLPPLGTWLSPGRLWQLSSAGPALQSTAGAIAQVLDSFTASARTTVSRASNSRTLEVVCVGSGLMLPLLCFALVQQRSKRLLPAGGTSITITALAEPGPSTAWLQAAAGALAAQHAGERAGASTEPLAAVCAPVFKAVPEGPYLKRVRHAARQAGDAGSRESGRGSPHQQQGLEPAEDPPRPMLLLVTEPYYSLSEGQLPWVPLLRAWSEMHAIRLSHPGHLIRTVPRRAVVWGVAASLPELWRTRHALGQVEGLDLSLANKMLGAVGTGTSEDVSTATPRTSSSPSSPAAGTLRLNGQQHPQHHLTVLPPLPCDVWQCGGGYRELSPRVPLLAIDLGQTPGALQGSAILELRHQPQLPISAMDGQQLSHGEEAGSGNCHAIVIWVDFDQGGSDVPAGSCTHSNGPHADGLPKPGPKQGVLLLNQPVAAARGVHGVPAQLRVTTQISEGADEMSFGVSLVV